MTRRSPRPYRFLAAMAGMLLLARCAVWAASPYQVQSIVRRGDRLGELNAKSDGAFFIGSLADTGQLVFVTNSTAGGQFLIQYADGRLNPVVVPGGAAPGGTWSGNTDLSRPVSMNQIGDVVFAANVTAGGKTAAGTFLWHSTTKEVTALALRGMPAGNNLTLDAGGRGGVGGAPAINDQSEVVLVAAVKDARAVAHDALFFLDRDSRLQPVALPGEGLPGGEQIDSVSLPSLSDAGVVALVARPPGRFSKDRLCLWESGTLTPLTAIDAKALDVPYIMAFTGVWVNNRNRNLLFAAHVHDLSGASNALYRFADGKVLPVAVPGQEMPGGGRFQTLQPQDVDSHEVRLATGVSAANAAGQHVFLATLEDRSTAAYLAEPDGKLSLILKSGMVTSLGNVLSVGRGAGKSEGVALNGKGQVAVTLRLAGGVEAVALLTPGAP